MYAFAIAWLLPRRRRKSGTADDAAGASALHKRLTGALSGPSALTVVGVIVIGLADVLGWLFEKGLTG
jgi:type IV secretory pathway VirB2 component (pilin)